MYVKGLAVNLHSKWHIRILQVVNWDVQWSEAFIPMREKGLAKKDGMQ